jgi:hypothetical protein
MNIDWGKIAKTVGTFGLSWLLDKYVAKHVPAKLVKWLGMAEETGAVPKELEAVVRALAEAKLHESMASILASSKDLEATLAKADRLFPPPTIIVEPRGKQR